MDEVSEVLTLMQTGKTRHIPVILVGTAFWSGLLEWIRVQMAGNGMISPEDLNLVHLIDEPANIVDAILRSTKRTISSLPTKSVSACCICNIPPVPRLPPVSAGGKLLPEIIRHSQHLARLIVKKQSRSWRLRSVSDRPVG
jgi:hypothetical protein